MTARISDRETFEALRARGVRVRRGELRAIHLPGPAGDPPRVAYAMTKRLGSAVVRNRLRRRLRAVIESEAAAGNVPAGATLISATPGAPALDGPTLRANVHQLLTAIGGAADRTPSPR